MFQLLLLPVIVFVQAISLPFLYIDWLNEKPLEIEEITFKSLEDKSEFFELQIGQERCAYHYDGTQSATSTLRIIELDTEQTGTRIWFNQKGCPENIKVSQERVKSYFASLEAQNEAKRRHNETIKTFSTYFREQIK